jgi:hypothetical protein
MHSSYVDTYPDLAPWSATAAAQPVPVRFGPVKRGGRWLLQPYTELDVWCGAVKLDLCGAELAAPEATLVVRAVVGTIKVWVPSGLRVIVDGTSMLGGRRVEENHLPAYVPAPTLYLRLDTVIGTVKVYRV